MAEYLEIAHTRMLQVFGKAFGCFQGIASPFKSERGPGDGCAVDLGNGAGGTTTLPLPMPPVDELNLRFDVFMSEMDFDEDHKHILLNLEPQKKWQLLQEQIEAESRQDADAQSYIEFLEKILKEGHTYHRKSANLKQVCERVESLKVALRTKPTSFVVKFLDLNGLELLLGILAQVRATSQSSTLMVLLFGCVKALLNNSHGRLYIIDHGSAIRSIAQALLSDDVRTKVGGLEIMGAICIIPGGHKIVLDAMSHLQTVAGERHRFQHLVLGLGLANSDLKLQTAIMSFLNALLKCGSAEESLEMRLHLRYEMLVLGIQNVIDSLRDIDSPVLENHLDLFEMMRQEDEQELSGRWETSCIDFNKPKSMFSALEERLSVSDAAPHFASLLHHLLQFPVDKRGTGYWRLMDRLCQQVALQLPATGDDPDLQVLDVDFRSAMKQLDLESELERAQEEIVSLHERLAETECKLAAAERGLAEEAKHLSKYRGRPLSPRDHGEDSQSVSSGVESEASDDQHYAFLDSPTSPTKTDDGSDIILLKPSLVSSLVNAGFAGFAPPPPPPPPPMPGIAKTPTRAQRKNIPKPAKPLKTFNWTRIPDEQLDGTIWTELDEAKLYKHLDLEAFEEKFSSIPKPPMDDIDFADNYSDYGTLQVKKKRLSVIDGRRAQNLTILLSKFKLSNSDILTGISNMDSQDILSGDLLEQLVKFLPTDEEISLLEENRENVSQMARADRFMLELSRIPRYEERVRCLYYRKMFVEKMAELRPKVEVVTKASKMTTNSKRLRKLLELVLAIGNYMNYGKRWKEAGGFQLSALPAMTETRCASLKDYTLMHYLVETAETHFPELLRLKRELSAVIDAAKISMQDLDAEMRQLNSGLGLIRIEIAQNRNDATNTNQLDAWCSFMESAVLEVELLNRKCTDMRGIFQSCVKKFGCNGQEASPDEFFGPLAQFLNSFSQVYRQIQLDREEEERRKRTLTKMPRVSKSRLMSSELANSGRLTQFLQSTSKPITNRNREFPGDFDQLISALQSGELFNEDLSRLRRSFRGSVRCRKARDLINAEAQALQRER